MDEGYHRYFASALEALSASAPARLEHSWDVDRGSAEWAVRTIHEAIDAADGSIEDDTGHVLRADAKFFLLLVFSQLMVQPVLAVRREDPELLLEQATADITR